MREANKNNIENVSKIKEDVGSILGVLNDVISGAKTLKTTSFDLNLFPQNFSNNNSNNGV